MSNETFKISPNKKIKKEKDYLKEIGYTQKKEKSPPSFISLKRMLTLIFILILFIGLNLTGYYFYKKGYLRIGADIIPTEEPENQETEGYSEDINLLPIPD